MTTPPAPRAGRIPLLTLAIMALTAGFAAAPAAAAPKAPLEYVALGDSYASGLGAPQGPGAPPYTACGRSQRGLPGLLDAKKQVALTANGTCAGAAAAVVAGGAFDVPEQIAVLTGAPGGLTLDTDLVTLSVGGNDAGFSVVAGVCAFQRIEVCAQAVQQSQGAMRTTVAASLDTVYAQLRRAAPNATVVVTGYPRLFSPEFANPGPLSAEAQALFNAATDTLNAVIEAKAEAAGFQYVDVVDEFEGHGIGSPDPWITFSGLGAPDDLHPTAVGYQEGYFSAVRSEVNLAQLRK